MPYSDPKQEQAYQLKYRQQHADKLSVAGREWRIANADALKLAKKADYERNKEAYKARAKASRERRVEELKARRSTPEYKAHRNALRRAKYESDETYRVKQLKIQKTWRADNAEKVCILRKIRRIQKPFWQKRYERALSKAYFNSAPIIDRASCKTFYKQIYTQSAATCDYCRGVFPIRDIVIDHKHPYALGGCHSISNFAISCHPCNRKKHTTPYDKWIAKVN